MAISTLDQLLAGFTVAPVEIYKVTGTAEAADEFHSTFYMNGKPGAGAAPSPGLAGAALTSYSGQIQFPAAVSGSNIYLAGIDLAAGGNIGGVSLYDRLWHNSGFTVTTTTAQTVNSATFPSRDTSGSTSGAGVMVALEVSSATGNVGAVTTITMSYTNSAGTAGRTATIASFPATAVAGEWVPFELVAGDVGVRSIQSLTLGTSLVSGTVHLVAYRPVVRVPVPADSTVYRYDAISLGMPRMFDQSVPFLVYLARGTALGRVSAHLQYAQG